MIRGARLQQAAGWAMYLFLALVALGALLVAAAAIYKAPSWYILPAVTGWCMLVTAIVHSAVQGKPVWRICITVILVSLALRLWSLQLVWGVEMHSDTANYTALARSVMAGQGLVVDDVQYGPGLRAFFPPLYPLLLAGFWSLFGESPVTTLAMNSVFDLAAAWVIADTGRRLGQQRAGMIAGLVYSLYPALMLSAGTPQKESAMLLLIALVFRQVAFWHNMVAGQRQWRHPALLGFFWGLLALVQPALVLVPPAMALALMPLHGAAPVLRAGMIAAPVCMLTLAPWWIRNGLLFGSFVPFTTAAGFAFNLSLGEARVVPPAAIFALPEPERSGAMARLVLERIAQVPGDHARGMLTSVVRAFGYEEAAVAQYRHTVPPIGPVARAWLTASLQTVYAAILACATFGAWQSLKSRQSGLLSLAFIAILTSICAANMWLEFGERHRHVLTPTILLIAASWLAQRFGPRVGR